MNKTIKIIATLLLALLLVATVSQVVLAASTYTGIIDEVDQQGQGVATEVNGVKTLAGKIIRVIRNIAAIAAIVIISILGIKYMMGSTQEKADYKKSFIPLIVGVVVVFGAAQIASMIFSVV